MSTDRPAEPVRYDMSRVGPDFVRAAERLHAECARAIEEGRIDARSPIGDATLDYEHTRDEDLALPASEACEFCGHARRRHFDRYGKCGIGTCVCSNFRERRSAIPDDQSDQEGGRPDGL